MAASNPERSPAGRSVARTAEWHVSPEKAGRLAVFLASGRADGLSGRFLAVEWDLEGQADRADQLAGTDALTLRLVPPPQAGPA